ncbi:hypothetical protein MES5069_270024 [Mesorhizobium escarrei]|uniref:Uncharacterized protein n=1 Tax=Mesorhizobium escarrei TaxID=666018 RepID=A0ABN8JRN5_9HYPH|nr:hypothetical protein MES5069_270024 [Mesorhizobium escarrei]
MAGHPPASNGARGKRAALQGDRKWSVVDNLRGPLRLLPTRGSLARRQSPTSVPIEIEVVDVAAVWLRKGMYLSGHAAIFDLNVSFFNGIACLLNFGSRILHRTSDGSGAHLDGYRVVQIRALFGPIAFWRSIRGGGWQLGWSSTKAALTPPCRFWAFWLYYRLYPRRPL